MLLLSLATGSVFTAIDTLALARIICSSSEKLHSLVILIIAAVQHSFAGRDYLNAFEVVGPTRPPQAGREELLETVQCAKDTLAHPPLQGPKMKPVVASPMQANSEGQTHGGSDQVPGRIAFVVVVQEKGEKKEGSDV
jgi:hypothetical protein